MSDFGENEEQQKKKHELIREIEDVIASAEIVHSDQRIESVKEVEKTEAIEVSELKEEVEPVKELVEDIKLEVETESVDIIENKEGYAEIVEEKHKEKKELEMEIEPVKFVVVPAKQHDIEISVKHEDHHSQEEHHVEEKPVEVAKPVEKKEKKWNFENVTEDFEAHQARIVVIGVGGAGNNTITDLSGMGVQGATTVVMNTDLNHPKINKAK